MKNKLKSRKWVRLFCNHSAQLFLILLFLQGLSLTQENQNVQQDRDSLIVAAREIMDKARYCALITVDEAGYPQARTMDPFAPDKDMVVWLGTNKNSRKVKEIKNNPRATLYYLAPDGSGYVVIKGKASLVNSENEKEKYWKEGWDQYYEDNRENYLLIKIEPEKLEIVSYRHNIIGDTKTWKVPCVDFRSVE